jgi:hypothetical protein
MTMVTARAPVPCVTDPIRTKDLSRPIADAFGAPILRDQDREATGADEAKPILS